MNGQRMWENVRNVESIFPPEYKRGPGRPKNLRRREPEEVPNPTKLREKTSPYQCRRCGKTGHNKSKCDLPPPTVDEEAVNAVPVAENAVPEADNAVPEAGNVMPITQSQQAENNLHINMNAGKMQKRKAPVKTAKPTHVKPAKPAHVSVKTAKSTSVKTAKPTPIKNAKPAVATSPVGHPTKMSSGIAKPANMEKRKDDIFHNNNES